MKHKVALMFGGNIGDTAAVFDTAVSKLQEKGFTVLKRSGIFVTAPVDCVPGTPDFLNQAVLGEWENTAEELLALTQKTEQESGRPAEHSSREARTLDIDMITFGDMLINGKNLTVPHPRAQQRRFVLEPLGTIAPGLRFPDSGMTVAELLKTVM